MRRFTSAILIVYLLSLTWVHQGWMESRTVAEWEYIFQVGKIIVFITYKKCIQMFASTTKIATAQEYGRHCPGIHIYDYGSDRTKLELKNIGMFSHGES